MGIMSVLIIILITLLCTRILVSQYVYNMRRHKRIQRRMLNK